MSPADRDIIFDEGRRIIFDMLDVPQPIIAAIEGAAVGLGATIALLCDVRIAAADAKVGDPHVKVGVVAGDRGAVIWPWLVGAGRAKRYLMTGDLIAAPDARAFGLIDELAVAGQALADAQRFAARLVALPRGAVRGTKASVNKLLREAANLVLDTSLALEKETMGAEAHRHLVETFLQQSGSAR
jgi:enoyl-CoA hydratase